MEGGSYSSRNSERLGMRLKLMLHTKHEVKVRPHHCFRTTSS